MTIPNPYDKNTDCELWSQDVVKILIEPFFFENANDTEAGLVTDQQIKEARESLRQALVWFYQTHL